MKRFLIFSMAYMLSVCLSGSTMAQTSAADTTAQPTVKRLTLGGYGEAVMSRNFYSDHFNRYKKPADHKDDPSHGRFDLPHVTLNLGYDFGRGWRLGMEIEFEHGGTESAVEVDADESGEYEAEVERGGEVALEQFWIEKTFSKALNLRMGEIIVPVGATNKYHMPTEFFTVYRPEGENSILPCTWHQTGVSLWGYLAGNWRYEVQFLSGLDSERFGAESFVHYGAGSPYEFKIANSYAGALRIDNYSILGLRLSASGYIGNTFSNTLRSHNASKYDNCKGTLAIGAFDMMYNAHNWIVRGNFDYAHLSDADLISTFNNSFPKHSGQDGTPSKHQPVGSEAVSAGIEAGYNIFSQVPSLCKDQKLYVFGRYEYYDSMAKGTSKTTYKWCQKNRFAAGVNYYPVKEVVVKAEYSHRAFKSPYNNEPSLNIGVAFSGWLL